MSLIGTFIEQASERPDALAIIDGSGRRITFGELEGASAARARVMRQMGVEPGDAVLVARGVSIELYETLLAIFRIGAVATFPEPAAGLAGVRHAIRTANPKAFAGAWLARLLQPFVSELRGLRRVPDSGSLQTGSSAIADASGDDPALITFTSGSTGAPKGIVRSVDFLLLQHRLLEELRQTTPEHVDLISLPVFILSNLAAGATSVIPKGRLTRPAQLDGGALVDQIEREGVTRIIAPPAVCARLTETDAKLARLTALFTGGGPVFPNLLHAMRAFAPEAAIHAVYGSTEAEPISHLEYRDVADEDWSAMSEGRGLLAGLPIDEIEVELVESEVQVSGAHVNRGYLDPTDNVSTKVERNGVLWHRTGDAASRDVQGRLWLLGRKDAASAGLFPFAAETAALSWPGVSAAGLCVVGDENILAVAGDRLDETDLRRRAKQIGDVKLRRVARIPMDKRHNSKVDYVQLRKTLA